MSVECGVDYASPVERSARFDGAAGFLSILRLFAAGNRAVLRMIIIDGVLWCLLCVMLALGFSNHGAVRRYASVSLRYKTPISGQAAYAARQYSVSKSDEGAFWPTFWTEARAALEGEFLSFEADSIVYSGDASLVWPATFVSGAAPGVIDGAGCAVSESLAWRLWGSADVVGMPVLIDGDKRIVRGVFKGESELVLLPCTLEDTTWSWGAAELSGGLDGATRSDAESYAQASGLGRPDSILMKGPSAVAAALSVLPIIIPAVYVLILALGLARKRFPLARKPAFYMGLILLAVLLPSALNIFPAWAVPTHWSDFGFWSSLLQRAGSGFREFLGAAPQKRDVELRMLLIKQAAITFPAACISLSICFRWHMRREKQCLY